MPAETVQNRIVITYIDPYRCIGCGTCVHSCFNDVLRMKRGKATMCIKMIAQRVFPVKMTVHERPFSLVWFD